MRYVLNLSVSVPSSHPASRQSQRQNRTRNQRSALSFLSSRKNILGTVALHFLPWLVNFYSLFLPTGLTYPRLDSSLLCSYELLVFLPLQSKYWNYCVNHHVQFVEYTLGMQFKALCMLGRLEEKTLFQMNHPTTLHMFTLKSILL